MICKDLEGYSHELYESTIPAFEKNQNKPQSW